MNTADYIVKKLEELGVNEFFGVPGDYNFNILYSIQNNPHTEWIGCTNELNAGYAADGYARIRGYGALVTTYGVGELSAANAIAGSNAEIIPVVHIVGIPNSKCIENKALVHHNMQNVNYNAFIDAYRSITATVTLLNRDNAKFEIDRVFRTLVKEKRPVYIAVPADVATLEISDRYVSNDWMSNKETLETAVEMIAEKINNSQKPIIIGDSLIKRFDALIEYKEFVTKSNIPVTNFLMGTNLINMDYENYLGGYFGNLRNPIVEKYVDESDCIISVGAIYSDLNAFGNKLPRDINNDIAIYGTYAYVDGKRYDDIKMSDVLDAVTKKIESKNVKTDKPNIGYKPQTSDKEKLTTDYIYTRLQEFFKENDIVIAETGTVPFGICLIKYPNNVNIQSQMLWGSIGWATPAAFGASVAKPQSRVILLTGDGAHQMTALEIGNMLRYGKKPVVIVINNDGYMIERALSEDPTNKFNDIVKMNYAKFARTFDGDIWATKVENSEDFDKALKVTQIMNKMCYIEACTAPFDLPALSKNFIEQLNGKKVENFDNIEETIYVEEQKNESSEDRTEHNEKLTKTAYNSFHYETTVHKSFEEGFQGDNTNE